MSVEVLTFGCRLNAQESDQAKARALADGLDDAVIVNTCAVTAEAVRQARQAIRRARRERPGARLVVTGCAAQIDPASFAAMPEVDLVLGNGLKSAKGAYQTVERVRVDAFERAHEAPPEAVVQDRARAYVAIQTGCDHRCTFCIIPYGRGPSRSTPAGDVVEAVRALTRAGVAEVVLTGVDITAWGSDLPATPTLGQLVGRILKLVPELKRLRLSSIDAAEIDPDLLRLLGDEPRLMPYLHLSLQAGDDMILKRMKRRHSREQSLALVAAVRRVRPDVAFGADLIAGFPTETDEMFENTLSLIRDAGLAYGHIFPFSPREGTPAARMPQLARGVVKDRAARLRAEAEAALVRHLDRQTGRVVRGLVEREGLARAEDFTEIAVDASVAPGSVVSLLLTGHDGRRAFGRLAA